MRLLRDVRDVRAIIALLLVGSVVAAVFTDRLEAGVLGTAFAVLIGYLFRAKQEPPQ